MEQLSVRDDDRPHLHPLRTSIPWPAWVLAIALIAGAGGYYYFSGLPVQPEAVTQAASPRMQAAPVPQPAAEPAIRHPLETPEPEATLSLPSLDNSDAMMRDSLIGLMGGEAFADIVIPVHLVRRIVATIDNLPQRTAPRRVLPLNAVPGAFVASGSHEDAVIDAANFARYAPYVRVMESLDAATLVRTYVRLYGLFQRAYEELGYSGRYFNDRLVEAIDDLLAAPDVEGPVALMRPKILYEFADPDLETRSAGQKILIRMGSENAARVKARLWELRRELIAASERRPQRGEH